MLYENVLGTIGNTPLVKLGKISQPYKSTIYAKFEAFNPGSSIKDRIALNMITKAEEEGLIKHGSHIVEPTSGNTGIGLALVCAVKGYRATLVMPESMSIERRKLLKALGAEIILTPKETGMQGSIAKAQELAEQSEMVFIPQQFKNKANPEIHRKTTAMEIWKDLQGKVDVFISAVGTGGTITGTGEKLRELNPKIHIAAIEPEESAVLSGKPAGPHGIQGMGAGFIPEVLNTEIYDEIIQVTTNEAYQNSRQLASEEGILVGISAGAALAAAKKYLQNAENESIVGQNIVIILPDTGERYLSTPLWDL